MVPNATHHIFQHFWYAENSCKDFKPKCSVEQMVDQNVERMVDPSRRRLEIVICATVSDTFVGYLNDIIIRRKYCSN